MLILLVIISSIYVIGYYLQKHETHKSNIRIKKLEDKNKTNQICYEHYALSQSLVVECYNFINDKNKNIQDKEKLLSKIEKQFFDF